MPSLKNSIALQPSQASEGTKSDSQKNTKQTNCATCQSPCKPLVLKVDEKSADQTITSKVSYCGENLPVPEGSLITAKVNSWDCDSYLDRIFRSGITLPAKEIEERRAYFIDAAQTEFDAEFLCRHLEKSDVVWSPEFMTFEREWRRDEYRHYVGFRRIFGRLYPDLGEEYLRIRIESEVPDFEPIRDFLRDEFNVLTAIVFDEACTAKSYADELKFFIRLGDPVFAEWLRQIAHDEANHKRNALAALKARHAPRLREIPALLDSFVDYDRSGAGYRNTFLFDHDAYSPEFVPNIVARLKVEIGG